MLYDSQYSPSLVLGFHGCDERIGKDLANGTVEDLYPSNSPYDWLGAGIYFFENDPARALYFAQQAHLNPKLSKGKIDDPFVIGAVIDLKFCLDLSSQQGLGEVWDAYGSLLVTHQYRNTTLPQNRKGFPDDDDFIVRNLDRAIINILHQLRRDSHLPPYDSVRSPFTQGKPVAETSRFYRHSHIQLAVRNANCILGYFLPQNPLTDPFQGLEASMNTTVMGKLS